MNRKYTSRVNESRPRLIERLRRRLDRDSYPRLQMLLIVAFTAGSGFLASSLLLYLGLHAMGPRYLLACVTAYLVFLFLLWIWMRSQASDFIDVPDPDIGSHSSRKDPFAGEGGQSTGGGASASYEVDSRSGDSHGLSDTLELAGDADEFAIPVFLILTALALLVSSLFVVWTAPVLFAELLVDGVLAASLYRRLRGLNARHWLETAIRRTFWPFLATTLIFTAVGYGLQHFSPRTTTVGELVGMHVKPHHAIPDAHQYTFALSRTFSAVA